MKSLTKKITVALLALIAAVCLALGIAFSQNFAFAAGEVVTVDGNSADYSDYFNIDGGVFKGFKAKDSDGSTIGEKLNGKDFELVLPDSVTSVADGTNSQNVLGGFGTKLKSLTLPAGLTAVGSYAFSNCTKLEKIIIPETSALTSLGANAFSGCSMLESITIPKNIKSIGANAFSGCTSVKEVNYNATAADPDITSPFANIGAATVNIKGTASAKILKMPHNLFRNTKVVSVTYNYVYFSGNDLFGKEIFSGCTSLKKVTFGEDCYSSEISVQSFEGCTALSEINLSALSELKTFGANSFNGCSALLGITIPSTVTTIAPTAFSGCHFLEVINKSSTVDDSTLSTYTDSIVKGENSSGFKTEGDFKFFEKDGEKLLVGYLGTADEITLPSDSGKYKIYKDAFRNNYSLKKVHIPETVTGIRDNAFLGCTSLTDVNVPKTVKMNDVDFGKAIFYGCTSLVNVNLALDEGDINKIPEQMFAGCTSLASINIPADVTTIGAEAFKGCTRLSEVTFTPYTIESKSYYRVQSYERSAFEGCTALRTMTIYEAYGKGSTSSPLDISFGMSVFSGCTNLEKLYIPAQVKFTGNDPFKGCTNALLIAPNKTAYDSYKSNAPSDITLTYPINIGLHNVNVVEGATAPADKTVTAFFNVDGQPLPTQDGYATSVWYETNSEGKLQTKVSEEEFNTKLKTEVDSIDLYAYYIAAPELSARPTITLEYKGSDLLTTENVQIWLKELGEKVSIVASPDNAFPTLPDVLYSVAVTKYTDMSGDNYINASMSGAGTYTLKLVLANSSDCGEWANGFTFEVSIAPQQISVEELTWGIVSGSSVSPLLPSNEGLPTPTPIYNYDNKWYTTKQYLDGTELPHGEDYTVTVLNSYVQWTGDEFTVKLQKDGMSSYIEEVLEYSGTVSATDGGAYTATVQVKMRNDYALPERSENYGITVTYLRTNNVYRIEKVWYIVSSNANRLLLGSMPYDIEGWTYLDGSAAPKAPTLFAGDENQLQYTLTMYENDNTTQDSLFSGEFDHANFSYYINGSMPAGYYVLSIEIPNDLEKSGVKYEGGTNYYTFTVAAASPYSLTDDPNPILTEYYNKIYADYTESVNFGITEDIMPILAFTGDQVHSGIDREGIWSNADFDKYYTGFVITFSYNGSPYMTEEEYSDGPKRIGEYIGIQYRASAPSYGDITGTYTLYIRGAVKVPTEQDLGNIDIKYTGSSLAGKINFNSEYYDVVYLNDNPSEVFINGNRVNSATLRENLIARGKLPAGTVKADYTKAGDYYVVLFIRSSQKETAKWSEEVRASEGYVEDSGYGECVIIKITIEKAQNTSATAPTVTSWNYGEFSKTANRPQWSTAYPTAQQFKLVLKTSSAREYYFDPAAGQDGFDKAPAGEYYLKPIALENDSVLRYEVNDPTKWASVTIGKANLSFKTSPSVASFKYGDDGTISITEGILYDAYEGAAGDITSYICKAADLGNAEGVHYADFADLKSKSGGHVPAGEWALVYQLAESANYSAWSYPVYFTVFGGDNYWEVSPTIPDFNYGEYVSTMLETLPFQPHAGNKASAEFVFRAYRPDGTPNGGFLTGRPGLEALLDSNGQLPAGEYRYTVTLAGGENYDNLTFESKFVIRQAENSWKTVPSVVSWDKGGFDRTKNITVPETAFGGDYRYTVKTSSGEKIEGLDGLSYDKLGEADTVKLLNGLAAGNYVLVVEVTGTDNYKGLSAEINFTVSGEEPTSLPLVIVTYVVAGITAGLAAAVLALLIIKNKKSSRKGGKR